MSDQPIHDQEALRIRKPQVEVNTPQADVPAAHVPPIVALQSVVGNRAMRRMVIQPKMTVTAANDVYESEADSVASQVVQGFQNSHVQREGAEEEEPIQAKRDVVQREGAEEEEPIQAKRDVVQRAGDMSGAFEVDDKVEGAIQGQLGGGQAMPEGVRGKMESGFGADFSGVRVHTDQTSDSLNRSVGAKAFTQGSDIFFKSGAFQPESSDGQQLLAHELTHTIQQGAVQQKREQES